jgi:hypothetical protein
MDLLGELTRVVGLAVVLLIEAPPFWDRFL